MVDRPPPSRFSVVERGGRLVVIDKETGQTPLSAAERMDLHDRSMGVEPIRPAKPSAAPDMSAAARAESGLSARPAPTRQPERAAMPPASRPMANAVAQMNNKRPWAETPAKPANSPTEASPPAARIAQRAPPSTSGQQRKTIVTGKWWDAKGPRTIELSPQGQREMTGGFTTLFFVVLIAAIAALFIAPVALFIGAFIAFQFGGKLLGPIGAGIIDKAIAEKG